METLSRDPLAGSTACTTVDAGDTPGVDPECGFAADVPTLHVCTTRDGEVVTGDKRCFSWARHRLLMESRAYRLVTRPCESCDHGLAAPAQTVDGVWFGPELCRTCAGDGVYDEVVEVVESADEHDWSVAS